MRCKCPKGPLGCRLPGSRGSTQPHQASGNGWRSWFRGARPLWTATASTCPSLARRLPPSLAGPAAGLPLGRATLEVRQEHLCEPPVPTETLARATITCVLMPTTIHIPDVKDHGLSALGLHTMLAAELFVLAVAYTSTHKAGDYLCCNACRWQQQETDQGCRPQDGQGGAVAGTQGSRRPGGRCPGLACSSGASSHPRGDQGASGEGRQVCLCSSPPETALVAPLTMKHISRILRLLSAVLATSRQRVG